MHRVLPRSAARTHPGRRPHNEDAHLSDDALGLYIVADGVGGLAKGEIASRQAVEEVAMWVSRHQSAIDDALERGAADGVLEACGILRNGVQQACYMLFGLAEQDPEKKGMSTTLSVLLLRGGQAIVAQVGDSRVYRLRDQDLKQLTEDHTLVNLRRKQGHPAPEAARKNVITRAVGYKDYVEVDVTYAEARVGDRYLLCSDGLYNYVFEPDELKGLLDQVTLHEATEKAVQLADERGGRDNITALMVEVLDDRAKPLPPQ